MKSMRELSDDAREAALRKHLEARYGVQVVSLRKLDRGVFDTQLADGRRWVTRVFSERRPLAQVEGDAAALRYLQQHVFPAERCADAAPVSNPHGWSVLVTDFIDGAQPDPTEPTLRAFGELLGRLHSLPGGDDAPTRPAGALHHYVPAGGSPADELAAAQSWLAQIDATVPARSRSLWESLQERLATADTCANLPECLIHPDPVINNLLASRSGELTLIDWTGAGRGPRLYSLAVALWSCALAAHRLSLDNIDPFAAGYQEHIRLDPEELQRLGAIIPLRQLMFACSRFRHAIAAGRAPDDSEWWWPSEQLEQAVAKRARAALAQ